MSQEEVLHLIINGTKILFDRSMQQRLVPVHTVSDQFPKSSILYSPAELELGLKFAKFPIAFDLSGHESKQVRIVLGVPKGSCI